VRFHPTGGAYLCPDTEFIAFSALRDQLSQVRSLVRYLNPEFLDEVCASCVLDDA
jgi:hypothetical protein